MKKTVQFVFVLFVMAMAMPTMAKDKKDKKDKKEGYVFTIVKDIPTTPVKNQYRSGTCWSFGGLAFLETELLRKGKGEYDLSEMFDVRYVYSQKAINYVRWQGNLNFGSGGNFHDVLWVFKTFGAVPEQAYSGLEYGEEKHVHGELDALLNSYVSTVIKNNNKKLSSAWHEGYNGILDAYLGEVSEKFNYNGVEFTPLSFAQSLDLNMDDYVEIGSYSHHPFYEKFILEIPDNWMMEQIYNVPLDEMMQIIENAIMNGYSVGWDADVSEKGFSWKKGVAIIPNEEKPEIAGMEKDKWEKMDEKEKKERLYSFDEPIAERVITQEYRQEQFDNYSTTDDHLMLLTGIANDQKGSKYFKVKNSWSEKGSPYDGFFYASKSFIELKSVVVLVHKDAIPQEIKNKLGIK